MDLDDWGAGPEPAHWVALLKALARLLLALASVGKRGRARGGWSPWEGSGAR
ncbi:hypothetical protein [Amycolatopsis sp. CA-128772]|uniref:hypothetical protein n=1 Tax=Amycolatopsis sp. CA-128772 TaxID=2073159 RepID=UPI001304E64C|nr:hypothetical protein [Amycolatopsis sp. CA-128772]